MIFRASLPLLIAAACFLPGNDTGRGSYARDAVPIWGRIAGGPAELRLLSPDGATRVIASYTEKRDGHVTLAVSGRIGPRRIELGPGVGSELLWSGSSDAFAVTTSDGGANGQFRSLIVAKDRGTTIVRSLSPLIHRAFGHPVKCSWPEFPNVGVIRWNRGSDSIIVAAEIIAHSNCDSFGTFRAYEVDWRSMAIKKTYNQLEAKHLFASSLGDELRNAPDNCVRSPKQCWVSTNHR